MSETLTFGPEWLRALSSGNSVTSPPPSPGPKYKLAEFRYGKEEMLALFIEQATKPFELEHFSSIAREKPSFPLAFIPPSEEEQRNSMGSVNSNAVLKLMGRGTPRGAVRGGRASGRGRGRGDGGFMRQASYEDTRPEGGGGFGRDPRRQSWEEGRRGGFERGRDTGPSRGYDPTTCSRPRLSSDSSWDRLEKDGDNWRSAGRNDDDDDGGGWRVSGARSPDKTERWRGGRTTRGTWRSPDSFKREGSFQEEEWQVARSSRTRSYHEKEEGKWSSPNDRLPEWSNDDSEDLDITGTFDSSGAFRSQKKDGVEDGRIDRKEVKENSEKKSLSTDKEQQINKANEEYISPPRTSSVDTKDDVVIKEIQIEEKTPAPNRTKSPSPPATPVSTDSQSLPRNSTSPTPIPSPQPVYTQSSTTPTMQRPYPSKSPEIQAPVLPPSKHEDQPVSSVTRTADKKEEEPNMEHFAKAAENLVMSLDDEDEKPKEERVSHQSGFHHHSPVTTPTHSEEVQWYYTDPQGKRQGPFTNSEMADWFKHGYFTMNLMIRRATDEVFQPLGELIKSWGRVPFHAGPQPPPLKSIPEHIQQQQILAQQQQYQELMRQHLIQQQFLHQQAFMLQQQQQMQQMQQMHQHPQPSSQHSPPGTSIPPSSTQPSQPQGDAPRIEIPPQPKPQLSAVKQQPQPPPPPQQQQQQQQRPQALSVSSESIWGPAGPTPTSPGMISPGPWSPVSNTTATAAKAWDVEASSKVQSLQEIQRTEEEKERKIKMENERREAEARALRQKQEEEKRRRQQEIILQRQREEEERRRQQEEIEKKIREQEELLKKQQEEARRKQEEELRRKQQQDSLIKQQQEQQRQQQQQQLEQQKRLEEQRIHEMRQQQQQALLRLQQQQQEMHRRKEMQKQMELQQKLQQKRQQNQAGNGSLWGSSASSAAPSLAQIQQQQEDRERLQLERQRLIQAQQEREQLNRAAAAGWAEHIPVGPPPIKSILEIQQEQSRHQARKQNHQLSRSHPQPQPQPSHNPLSSSVWGNNSPSLSASWTTSAPGTVWGGLKSQQQSRYLGTPDEEEDDDDEDDDDDEESFWDEAVKAATKANPTPQPKQQMQHRPQPVHANQNNNPTFPTLGLSKGVAKKTNRDEESVRRLFQQHANTSDEFTRWCDQTLRTMKVTGVDIPTFIVFLKEVDSPYEIYDYVKSYVGDTREAREFAKEFIERRKKQQQLIATSHVSPAFNQGSVWGTTAAQPSYSNKTSAYYSAMSAQEDSTQNNLGGESAASKKKKKKRMQKVDPSILGFSVNAADRVNIGEIQTLEDV